MKKEEILKLARSSFVKYDTDQNGNLDKKELKLLLTDKAKEYGVEPPTSTEIDKLFEEYDFNSDNKLSEQEFIELFSVILEMKNNS